MPFLYDSDNIFAKLRKPFDIRLVRRRESVGSIKWSGTIVGREWPIDMPAREIEMMRVGGNKNRLGGVLPGSANIYELTDWELREAKRLMDRHCLDGFETKNVACNAGRTNILTLLSFATTGANTGYTGIVSFAVGDTSGTVSASDTTLIHEVFRKGITTYTITSTQIAAATNFGSSEGNFAYQDAGIFGSTPANTASTTTANTGILYAHASYSYTKTSAVSLTNDYYVTLS